MILNWELFKFFVYSEEEDLFKDLKNPKHGRFLLTPSFLKQLWDFILSGAYGRYKLMIDLSLSFIEDKNNRLQDRLTVAIISKNAMKNLENIACEPLDGSLQKLIQEAKDKDNSLISVPDSWIIEIFKS
jgi:hypothetical protein